MAGAKITLPQNELSQMNEQRTFYV